ncbi:hypothetical protein [Halogranum rubrum]|uniref:Uncharacterized protein n=1 Tax=Halogranum salarium B-1 TaxID=1210908 RepID=J2ZE79_9EURY|nr:hypothetical protein [Halogranum salarium]EJN58975.1 hypothetical protein HSB1_23960 [Halogranum salarium B-1]
MSALSRLAYLTLVVVVGYVAIILGTFDVGASVGVDGVSPTTDLLPGIVTLLIELSITHLGYRSRT